MSGNRRGFRSYVYLVLTTSRPLYWPQLGQTECGRFGCLQFGHGWIWTRASARWERRRPFFDLDSLTFGSAMDPGSLREPRIPTPRADTDSRHRRPEPRRRRAREGAHPVDA